ncbi:hypothetical protein [Stenotrophomonas sp. 24(2023)]|uniref:hypothetical protein n=1 Tax=Stenotrophomonas sp. 24(2023) TaxID=3068324 RepID=UPI0027E06979|nr:hypothetical protein [Stenotrophomonas sp. 24(2023)]WMJ68364.1 hypothetical protein Q9R17_14330 [Stenotrophomonas sp. 24(2023)]
MGKGITVAAASLLVAFSAGAQAGSAGLYTCNACSASVPFPEPATTVFLKNIERKLNAPIPRISGRRGLRVGDTIEVCNGITCVEYTWLGRDDFRGRVTSTVLPPNARSSTDGRRVIRIGAGNAPAPGPTGGR